MVQEVADNRVVVALFVLFYQFNVRVGGLYFQNIYTLYFVYLMASVWAGKSNLNCKALGHIAIMYSLYQYQYKQILPI